MRCLLFVLMLVCPACSDSGFCRHESIAVVDGGFLEERLSQQNFCQFDIPLESDVIGEGYPDAESAYVNVLVGITLPEDLPEAYVEPYLTGWTFVRSGNVCWPMYALSDNQEQDVWQHWTARGADDALTQYTAMAAAMRRQFVDGLLPEEDEQ